MKKTILFLSLGLLFNAPAKANTQCFLAKENSIILKQEGDCKTRHSPCSTFKIAISLMGYNEGLLRDETHPMLPFKNGYADHMENWKAPHNPTLWMKNSCIWYSQVLTQELGMKKFTDYVTKFNYGNKDVSGDKGQDNGLTRSWLSSSLEISPEEQIVFLQNMLEGKLPVSFNSQEITKNILFHENLPEGWKFYGKTGSGTLPNADKSTTSYQPHGWFVGFIQKDKRTIYFAEHIENYAGPDAKAFAKAKLLALIASEKK
jgi:beta-lactamase class D